MFRKLTALFVFALMSAALPVYAARTLSGDVIVVLKNQSGMSIRSDGGTKNLSGVKAFTKSANVRLMQTYDSLSESGGNVFMLVHSDTLSGNDLLEKIRSMPGVVGASLNRRVYPMASREPDDPEYYRLWGMQAVHAPEVWDSFTGTDDVYAVVIDTGIDYEHEDLKDNVSLEYSRNFAGYGSRSYDAGDIYDNDDHGTHCAGIIAAQGDNGKGIAGISWRAKIIALKVFTEDGSARNSDIIAAVDYVVKLMNDNPAMKIASVNMSLGGYDSYTPAQMRYNRDPEWLALKTLSDKNRTVICVAAGNEGLETGAPSPEDDYELEEYDKGDYIYPASFVGIDNMITVAAAKPDLTQAEWSNYSSKYVDIAAPGAGIFSSIRTDTIEDTGYDYRARTLAYGSMSGTSMATPFVAGTAALLKSIYPNATASQIKAAILGGADGNYLRGETSRHGLLNVKGAADFLAANNAPEISRVNVPEATIGQPYNLELYASGGQPIAWSIDGELPDGMAFSGGKITGTPRYAGEKSFAVTAQNSYGTDSVYLTLTVNPAEAPKITTRKLENAAVNQTYYATFDAEGSWPITWNITGSRLPENIYFDNASGYLQLLSSAAASYTFTVTAENSSGKDSRNFTLNITDTRGQAPIITTDSLMEGTLGRRYGADTADSIMLTVMGMPGGDIITANGDEPVSWNIAEGNLPEGLFLDTSYGIIYGVPEESGDFTFTAEAYNAFGMNKKTFTISIKDKAPEFLGQELSAVMYRGVYDTRRIITSGTAPMSFRTEGDSLPQGLAEGYSDCTYRIYGRPEEAGTFRFTLYAENSSGTAGTDVKIEVIEPATITTYYLPDAVKGTPYSYSINTLGGANASFSRVSGDIPPSMAITQAGVITGTPSSGGRFKFRVRASTERDSSERDFTLNVIAPPEILTSSLSDGRTGETYSTALQAEGDSVSWALTGGSLPGGLALSSNGYIYGTPGTAGTYDFTVSAINGAGNDTRAFTVNISSSGSENSGQGTGTITLLPANAITATRARNNDISALSPAVIRTVSTDTSMIAAVLDEFTALSAGTYLFGSIDIFPEVPAGLRLVWHPFPSDSSGVSVSASDSDAVFLDTSGSEIYAVPENHTVSVMAHIDAGVTYAPVIAAEKGGGNKDSASGDSDDGGGGCNISYGAAVMAALMLMKKRR